MEAAVQPRPTTPATVLRGKLARLEPAGTSSACILSDGGRILVSNFLTAHIRPGDQIDVPLLLDSPGARTEIYIRKTSARHDLYQAFIGYAAQPKNDKREQLYVRAEVPQGRLGIRALHFPCGVLRDYFYRNGTYSPTAMQGIFYS